MTELGSPFAEGPRMIQGPGASVGGSVILGYLLAAVAGVALAAGLAWLSGSVLRLPIVYPLLIGWGIRRALAAGAGGGTPDRGPIGVVVLLAIVVAAFAILRYGEYLSTDRRESEHYRAVYGGFPTADAKTVEIALHARADAEGKIWIPESKRSVDADEEIARLQGQMIAHELPTTAYDIALISAVGKKGFKGHLQKAITKGDTVAIRPQSAGWSFPGFAIVVLWIAEFALLLVSSFSRIDDD